MTPTKEWGQGYDAVSTVSPHERIQKWLLQADAVKLDNKEIWHLLEARKIFFEEGLSTIFIVKRIKKVLKENYNYIGV